jgi:hypothetical protein
MKNPEWPGIATAVGILFLIGLIAVGSRDDFHLKDWQPLMASILAIGGALIVYRGAKLAYNAAMAKVDLDREAQVREAARLTLGVCLRLEFSLRELLYEVREELVNIPEWDNQKMATVRITDFNLALQSKLDEAWANLDRLPRQLSQTISEIRAVYFDYKNMLRINPSAEWTYGRFKIEPPETIQLRRILKALEADCVDALKMTGALAADLTKRTVAQLFYQHPRLAVHRHGSNSETVAARFRPDH